MENELRGSNSRGGRLVRRPLEQSRWDVEGAWSRMWQKRWKRKEWIPEVFGKQNVEDLVID